MNLGFLKAAVVGGILAVSASAALATPIGTVETFSTSIGTQPSNAGIITLTQISANAVQIFVDLAPNYGFINSGGPHTPLAFQLNVSGGLSISSWTTPTNGTTAASKVFSLDTAGGSATPYGTYNTALDYSGGNGSAGGYFGDLKFTLSRTTGIDLTNFISNGTAFFAADLSNGSNTGSQAWTQIAAPTVGVPVPEPFTFSLFGAGLLGAGALRRRQRKSKAN
jgi:hypothetical protein